MPLFVDVKSWRSIFVSKAALLARNSFGVERKTSGFLIACIVSAWLTL